MYRRPRRDRLGCISAGTTARSAQLAEQPDEHRAQLSTAGETLDIEETTILVYCTLETHVNNVVNNFYRFLNIT